MIKLPMESFEIFIIIIIIIIIIIWIKKLNTST